MSCATEVEVIVELSVGGSPGAGRAHGLILMVELGDLREGIMPADLLDTVARCLALRTS